MPVPRRGLRSYNARMMANRAEPATSFRGKLLVLFLLALATRLVYLAEIRDIGFFRNPVSDGAVYWFRAAGIAGGDWRGPADFVHAPFYAYLLGLLWIVAGPSFWLIRILQALAGATACVVVAATGARRFGRTAGSIAGLMLALCPAAIFFDGLIQKTSWELLFSALLLWVLLRGGWRPLMRAALAGLLLGLLILNRQNALALVPLVLAWVCLRDERAEVAAASSQVGAKKGSRPDASAPVVAPPPVGLRRWASAAVCAAALGLTLLPWTIRNRLVIGSWTLTTPNLGQNFAMGNCVGATGTYIPFIRGAGSGETEQRAWTNLAEKSAGRKLTPAEVSDHFLNIALRFIREHPGEWLGITLKKHLMTWNAYEQYDTEDLYVYKEHSRLLTILDTVWHFGMLAALAVLGMALTWSRRRALWPLYAWLLLNTVAIAMFVVFARYRVVMLPVLMLFAGAAGPMAPQRWRERGGRGIAGPVVALLLAAVAANWPLDKARRPEAQSYTNLASALNTRGRYDEALRELDKAEALTPGDIEVHLIRGNVFAEMNRMTEAVAEYQAVIAAEPTYGNAHRRLGAALLKMQRFTEAEQRYRLALTFDERDLFARHGLATALARQGQADVAIRMFEEILAEDSSQYETQLNLGNTLLALGRLDEAERHYRASLKIKPDYAEALLNMGVIAMHRGHASDAIDWFRRVLELAPEDRAVQGYYATALLDAGRLDEARSFAAERLEADPSREDMRKVIEAAQARRGQ